MREHHRRTIDRFVEFAGTNPVFLAIVLGGSIAKGLEREDSDVDVMILVTPEEMARRAETGELAYYSPDFADYPGGYLDGKFIDEAYLRAVAERGSEPARFAFDHAQVLWTRVSGLQELVRSISKYPEAERSGKMQSYVAQLYAMQWYAEQAEKLHDGYLLQWAGVRAIHFAFRLILAHNRMLYPYQKWLRAQVERAPDKPDNLCELADRLVTEPGRDNIDRLVDCLFSFRSWEMPARGWPNRFLHDTEQAWLNGRPPVEDY